MDSRCSAVLIALGRVAQLKQLLALLLALALAEPAFSAGSYTREDVTFQSKELKLSAWLFLPKGTSATAKHPAIVMGPPFSAVKEMGLNEVAARFASEGFAVIAFDYRTFGGSEGEPRCQLIWYEQVEDYRNAITWISARNEVDPERIGVWGFSYSGAHVLHLSAFDKRVKAVVSMMPQPQSWEAFYAPLPAKELDGMHAWIAQSRLEWFTTGKAAYFPVVSANGKDAAITQSEGYEWFTRMSKQAPRWENRMTVDSLEKDMFYDPVAFIGLIAPTPLLVVAASDDTLIPFNLQKAAFERAGEPKKFIEVKGGHFAALDNPSRDELLPAQVDWFKRHLTP